MNIVIRCHACNREMVQRVNRKTQSEFLGCTGYPECQETRPIPEYVRLVKAGAKPLPGMEP